MEQRHILKVQMITCLGLDVFLELFDINVNETGSLIQTKLLFSWLGSLVLTIYNNRYNIFITKQWSTAQEDQGQKKKFISSTKGFSIILEVTGIT